MSRSLEGMVVRVLALLPLVGIVGLLFIPGDKATWWLLIAAAFAGNVARGLLLARESFSAERIGEFLGWMLMLVVLLMAYAASHRLAPSLVHSGPPLREFCGDYRLEDITLAVEPDGRPDAEALALLDGPPASARVLLEHLVFAMANARAAGCPAAGDLGTRARKVLRGELAPEPLLRGLGDVLRGGGETCVRSVHWVTSMLARPALLGAAHLELGEDGMRVEIDTAASDGSPTRGHVVGLLPHHELARARAEGLRRVRLLAQSGSLWGGILPASLTVSVLLGPDARPLRIEGRARDGQVLLFHADLRSCR